MGCIRLGDKWIKKIYLGDNQVHKIYMGDTLVYPCYSKDNVTSEAFVMHRQLPSDIMNMYKYIDTFYKDVTYWLEYDLTNIVAPSSGTNERTHVVYSYFPAVASTTTINNIKNNMNVYIYDSDGTTLLHSETPAQYFYYAEKYAQGDSIPSKRYIKIEYNYNNAEAFWIGLTSNHITPALSSSNPSSAGYLRNGTSYELIDGLLELTTSYQTIYGGYATPGETVTLDAGGVIAIKTGTGSTIYIKNTNSFDIAVKSYNGNTLINTTIINANSESTVPAQSNVYPLILYVYPQDEDDQLMSFQIKET